MKPKVVIFDLGKVLLDFDYGLVASRVAARGKKSAEEIAHFLLQTRPLYQFETGLLTKAEFHRQVCDATGYCGTADDFAIEFGDIFTPIDPMIQLQAELRAGGVPTFIFSNTNELAINHIKKAYPFFGNFDGYILSYEHRAMKPDPAIYKVVEKVSGCSRAELLYLDDRPENTAQGSERGWQTITHYCPVETREKVVATGLLA